MRRKRFGLLIPVLATAAAVLLGLGSVRFLQESRIRRLEESVRSLEEELIPLRFMVLERGGGTLRARVRLYDLAGGEVNWLETSWPGTELAFDFTVVSFAGRYLAFPRRVFTDRIAPSAGTDLYPLYDREEFPAVFEGGGFGDYGRAKLTEVFRALRAGDDPPGAFGSAVHDVARIAAFEPGVVYRVVARSKGGIEIREE